MTTGKKRTPRRRQQGQRTSSSSGLFRLITLLLVGGGLFVVLGKSVNYSSRCENVTKQMAKKNTDIKALRSELQYLQIEAEELRSRDVVFENVKRFKLDLRPAKPYQVRYLNEPTIEERRMAQTRLNRGRTVAAADTAAMLSGN